jgi:hypothetical protein
VLSSSLHDFSKHSRPLRLFDDAKIDFRLETVSVDLPFGVEPFEEQLACEPEPEVSVELLLIDVFVSELNVLVSGFFATGDTGGVETRELMHDSVSLSSVVTDLLCDVKISEVRGGFTGGDLIGGASSIDRLGAAFT